MPASLANASGEQQQKLASIKALELLLICSAGRSPGEKPAPRRPSARGETGESARDRRRQKTLGAATSAQGAAPCPCSPKQLLQRGPSQGIQRKMGDDEFSLRTSSPRIVPAAPKTPQAEKPTLTLPQLSTSSKGLSNVEIARQLLKEELTLHQKKKPPPEPTAFSRLSVRNLPWKRKGFLKDHRKPWEPPKIALKQTIVRDKAANCIIKWWCYHRQTLYMYRLRVLFYQHHKVSRRRVVRFGEEQRQALRSQAQSFKDHADALCDEASKRGGDWRQMLDELAAARHQIASERSDNAREYAEQSEQRARDIDDEEERQRRAAKDAARERTEAFNAEREALAKRKAEDAHKLAVDRAEIKANMDFKCGVDPVKRFLAGLQGSVADSVQLAEAPAPAPLVEAPAPAPNAAAPAPARGAVYVDPATGVAYGAGYVVGPPADPDDLRQKMRDDFLLLMRAQTLLPAPTKALLKFYAKAWDEAPPAHWSDVIRGLCDEGLVQATRDAAGEPVEVWF